jgi:hypothetical protein
MVSSVVPGGLCSKVTTHLKVSFAREFLFQNRHRLNTGKHPLREKRGSVCFLSVVRKMLQWEPEKRSSARELAEDEWILMQTK